MGFLRYQQVRIEADGRLRELSPRLHTIVRATYRQGDQATATVTVHHPAPDTVTAMRATGAVVEVVSGYVEDGPSPGIIVRGRVIAGSVREVRQGTTHTVEVQVRPADVRSADVVPAKSWATVTGREVWDYVVRESGMDAGRPPPDAGADYRGGFTLRGDPSPILRRVARDAGWRYTVSGGVVDVWGDVEAADIGPDTGLIGSAQRSDDGRVSARIQLRPDVRPGSRATIRSRALGASAVTVRVVETDISADSREGSFEVAIVGEEER